MLGVTFGEKHSFHDLKLWLRSYPQISPPKPKKKQVEVMGLDGMLDLSRTLTGYMLYERRTITMEFNILGPRAQWPDIHSDIMDMLHGAEMDVILDDDPEYCYTGTMEVDAFDPQQAVSVVKITADVEPYKTKLEVTRRSYTVSGSLTTAIFSARKPVIPLITASAAMKLTFGGRSHDLKAGANELPDVILQEGENVFTFTGSGTISMEYREGRF